MAFEDLLDHLCDIYHSREAQETPGWGLPASPSFSYPDAPDIRGQRCHFGIRLRDVEVIQTAPANLMDARIKLALPAGTDVRLGDRIVDCGSGLAYTAEQPASIRGHHVFVHIKRAGGQKAL